MVAPAVDMQKNVKLFEKLTEAAKAIGEGIAITDVEGTGYTNAEWQHG